MLPEIPNLVFGDKWVVDCVWCLAEKKALGFKLRTSPQLAPGPQVLRRGGNVGIYETV
jgi:hypothetical protein